MSVHRVVIGLLILMCFSTLSEAQITLSLAKPSSLPSNNTYFIQAIHSDKGNDRTVGEVILGTKETYGVKMKTSLASTFSTFFEGLHRPDSTKTPVIFQVKDVQIKENGAGNKIQGSCQVLLDFYALRGTDTLFLCSAVGKQAYERSYSAADPKRFEQLIAQNARYCLTYFHAWLERNQARHEAFVRSCRIILLPDYALNDADTLYYPTRPITWEDFQKKKTGYSKYAAGIFVNIAKETELSIQDNVLYARIQPKVFMVRSSSWVSDQAKDDYSLQHEQLHFDIGQVVMNRYKKKLLEINETSPDDLISRIHYEYLEAYREMNHLQEAYDNETQHSLNKTQQAEWERKIKEWLRQ